MYLTRFLPADLVSSLKQTQLYRIYHRRNLLSQKSLSQTGQDYWLINEAFAHKKQGFFVEIGSTDGVHINNTYLLEQRYNWQGICIEPNPEFFKELVKNRQSICLEICIDEKLGEIEFYFEGIKGGIISEGTDNFKRNQKVPEKIKTIKTFPLVDILKKYQAPKIIDYLSIDVEGAEMRILGKFPFEEYQFRCMTIERASQELKEILAAHGYILVQEIPGLDSYFIHQSFKTEYQNNSGTLL